LINSFLENKKIYNSWSTSINPTLCQTKRKYKP